MLESIGINNAIKREFIEKNHSIVWVFWPYHITNGFYEKKDEFWYESHLSTMILKDFMIYLLFLYPHPLSSSFILFAPIAIFGFDRNLSLDYYFGITRSNIVLNQLKNEEKTRIFDGLCIIDTRPDRSINSLLIL